MHRIGVALLGMMLCFATRAEIPTGTMPPDALGRTQHGQRVSVSSLRGKVVVISFWATWCGYCMKEMPILASLQSLASERGLALQVVSINYGESRQTFVQSSRALRKNLPDLLITWDPDGAIGHQFGTENGIPVMVMLHRDGTVAHTHIGYGEDMLDGLVAEINALLNEPLPAATVAATN